MPAGPAWRAVTRALVPARCFRASLACWLRRTQATRTPHRISRGRCLAWPDGWCSRGAKDLMPAAGWDGGSDGGPAGRCSGAHHCGRTGIRARSLFASPLAQFRIRHADYHTGDGAHAQADQQVPFAVRPAFGGNAGHGIPCKSFISVGGLDGEAVVGDGAQAAFPALDVFQRHADVGARRHAAQIFPLGGVTLVSGSMQNRNGEQNESQNRQCQHDGMFQAVHVVHPLEAAASPRSERRPVGRRSEGWRANEGFDGSAGFSGQSARSRAGNSLPPVR